MSLINVTYPRDRDTHTLADFMELLCLISMDGELSISDMDDYIKDNKGQTPFAPLNETEGVDILNQVSWRQNAFGSAYPFSRRGSSKVIRLEENTTSFQNLYIFFLLCANLPMLERSIRQKYTDGFELFSLQALKLFWPAAGSVTSFGKNTSSFDGAKHERMNQLSSHIGGKADAEPYLFRERDSGDGGIDLAAWLKLDNHESQNIPSALAQCACSREQWPVKQSEIAYERLSRVLSPSTKWTEFLFCPISFRNNLGRWAYPAEVAAIVLVDRLRLMSFLADLPYVEEGHFPSVFNETIQKSMDLV